MTLMRRLGRNVQRERTARGWTQAELARRVGTSRIYLAQIEGGFAKACSLPMLARVAKALRVKPGRLLD
jgi:transcriptional regulator with XRE-family HTH domain